MRFFLESFLHNTIQINMSSLRSNKNIQSAVASAVFVGLRAEHSHITELHTTKLFSDNDKSVNVFETINDLKTRVEELTTLVGTLLEKNTGLTETLEKLCMKDLADVKVDTVPNGDALVFQNGQWQPAELFKEEEQLQQA